jgi:hypothetical protein
MRPPEFSLKPPPRPNDKTGMSPPYIPPTDTDFNSWIDNFSAVLTAAPATYGLLAADATVVAGVTATWDAAYTAAINPATRSPVTVQAKIDAKLAALATVRPYAQQIANNVGVTAPAKIAIGVNPRTTPPSPITAPVTNPILSIPSMTPLGHVLRYRDELASPTVKAKPGAWPPWSSAARSRQRRSPTPRPSRTADNSRSARS